MLRSGFKEYKPIRNYLRKYSRESLLKGLIEYSLKASRMMVSDQRIQYASEGYPQPWELAALGRLLIWDWCNVAGNKPVNENVIFGATNKLRVFSEAAVVRLKPNGTHIAQKTLRGILHKQHFHQISLYNDDSGRVLQLLVRGKFSAEANEGFREHYGMALEDFFNILIIILSHFIEGDNKFIVKKYFQNTHSWFDSGAIDSFFRVCSLNKDDFGSFNNDSRYR